MHNISMLRNHFKSTYKSIESTVDAPRRASVAIILRENKNNIEILYIRRTHHPKDRWSSHIAFPGGRKEENETDEGAAIREVQEEVGLDLTSPDFEMLGRLNDREIKDRHRQKRIMVLCTFVFLQLSKNTPEIKLQPNEVASCYFIPISYLESEDTEWDPVVYPLSKVFTRFSLGFFDQVLNIAIGCIKYFGIQIPQHYQYLKVNTESAQIALNKNFPLWGLTLSLTSELLMVMGHENISIYGKGRFTFPDIEFLCNLGNLKKRKLPTWRLEIVLALGLRALILYKINKF